MIKEIVNTYLESAESIGKEKTSFWASDAEKNLFDLYHNWIGTPYSNTIDSDRLMIFRTGKAVEEEYINLLIDAGVAVKPDGDQHAIEIEREGVRITGKLDGIILDEGKEIVLEVKSFYMYYQERELLMGKPKTSYLKQLAIYMDARNADKGILFYVNRGTGKQFEFTLFRKPHTLQFFMENGITFDLSEEYKRWGRLYYENVKPRIEPVSDYIYKYDIDGIDWTKISKADISKARNGHKVLGDWQVLYSPYKHLIIEREGSSLGYDLEEIAKIKELTKGYTSKSNSKKQ